MRRLTLGMVASAAVLMTFVANGAEKQVQTEPGALAPSANPADTASAPNLLALPGEVADPSSSDRAVSLKSVPGPRLLSSTLPSRHADFVPNSFYYYTVPGVNYQPKDASTTVTYDGGGCINTTNGGQVIAKLNLPDGAMVQYLRMYYNRTAAQSSNLYFTRYNPSTAAVSDVFFVAATGTGQNSDQSTLQTEVVDNSTFGYTSIWTNTGDTNNKLCGGRVAYYVPPSGTYNPITPCRVFDTRGSSPLTPGGQNFQISGHCGVPPGATAVTANVTVVNTTANGSYLAIWPQGTSWPGNSTLNYNAGQIVANAADLVLSPSGMITAKCAAGTTDLVFDVTGYFY